MPAAGSSPEAHSINNGIAAARRNHRLIDETTARKIADAFAGPDTALAFFADTSILLPGDECIWYELMDCRWYFGEAVEPWVDALEDYVLAHAGLPLE